MNTVARSIRIVPVTLVMGTIFFLSHQPGTELQLPHLPGLDKLAHGLIYAGLAAAGLYGVPEQFRRARPKTAGALVVFFCLLYGITDEYHQSFIPGRVASLGDLAADAAGAAFLVGLWLRNGPAASAPPDFPDQ
ncbi:MAG: VanZ family protein [Desulfobulbaceae bacterium]|nr:VanZ family protein [Desulfobulbaceae bacterium]